MRVCRSRQDLTFQYPCSPLAKGEEGTGVGGFNLLAVFIKAIGIKSGWTQGQPTRPPQPTATKARAQSPETAQSPSARGQSQTGTDGQQQSSMAAAICSTVHV